MTLPSADHPLRYLFALPGFHREERGAEIALLAVAGELARAGQQVTVIGAGPPRDGCAYAYRQAHAINRRRLERLPQFPPFRSETVWEDASFAASLLRAYEPQDFDVTVTCNFPFTHWALRRGGREAPKHIFVTQNGDWPARNRQAEFRTFRCDGLVCTNPDYEAANRARWRTALIPNGIDPARFAGVAPDRTRFGLPPDKRVVLMVSAFIETKRVIDGMRAVAEVPGAHFAVAGDGPLRGQVESLALEILPGRFTRLELPAAAMPALYRSADAFLHMSLTESFGNVYVEAMASGLPIVAHDSARLRWIVGERDTLCDTTDHAATVAALTRALETGRGQPDPRAEGFAWSAIAARYHAFAHDVLRG
ncbi:glycosyltransferase family 4 protein [Qipengyuania sediminis]|uniref:glycosyltransferase family 4 protein n=1 Tax=Qipengyuania sediminis TaxID=1532023 RepID=UPI0019816B6A|nr:glycosyltransferase family 4 protein [Qipengyuania sediminis]